MKFLLLILFTISTSFAGDVQLQGAFSGQKGGTPLFDYAKIDNATNSLMFIDYEHHEVHSGSSYLVSVSDADLDTAEVLSVCFKTPNTTKWIHLTFALETSVKSTLSLNEGVTVTTNSGTSVTAINHNRNSSNTSGVIDYATTPAAGNVTKNGTITADGTVLLTGTTAGSRTDQIVSSLTHNQEFVLKQNTGYCISITSNADNNVADIRLDWYEHTNISR